MGVLVSLKESADLVTKEEVAVTMVQPGTLTGGKKNFIGKR